VFVKYYTYRYNSVIRIVFLLSAFLFLAFESVASQHKYGLYTNIIIVSYVLFQKRQETKPIF